MKEIVEIYSKIVVATFGFIGPSFTLLISIFIDAIEKARAKNVQQLQTIQALYADLYNQKDTNKDMEKGMKDILKKNDDHKKQIQKEANLLNPKRQIKRVFLPLIASLFFIASYYFAKTNYCPFEQFVIKIISLIASAACFCYCLFVLWQILNMVIEAKQDLIKDKTDKVVKQEEKNILGDKN